MLLEKGSNQSESSVTKRKTCSFKALESTQCLAHCHYSHNGLVTLPKYGKHFSLQHFLNGARTQTRTHTHENVNIFGNQ